MKVTVFNDEARSGLQRGVNLITDAIKCTLGPKGRNVVYGFHYGYPISTKDGVTVAQQVESHGQLEQLGVLLIRQVSQKTADDSGDGTTTAAVLAQAIFNEGLKVLSSGANPILIKRGIDRATDDAIKLIEAMKKEVTTDEDILNVATISANNDIALGKLVAMAVAKVGKEGVITIEDNYTGKDSEVFMIEGMQLNEGMLSPFFITDTEKLFAHYDNPKILLVDGEINDIMPFQKLINETLGEHKRPLVIIAHNVTGTALQALTATKAQNGAPLLACKASQFGEYRSDLLSDVAIATNATIVGGNSGIKTKDITYAQLGESVSLRADRFTTTILGGKADKEALKGRIALLEGQMEACKSDYDKQKIQERLAKLTTGVAVVKVGGSSELEQKERKMRVEDSLHATKAAHDSGVVPGGGVTLLNVSEALVIPDIHEEEKIGYKIVKQALKAPLLLNTHSH